MEPIFYIDDEEEGLSPLTSHPNFNKVISNDFYFDCMDEISPFGNDEGAEILYSLQDLYLAEQGKVNVLQWLYDRIDGYGFVYSSKDASVIIDKEQLKAILLEDPNFISCMDEAIIGAAFGQYKIEGKIEKRLKEVALLTIERKRIIDSEIIAQDEINMKQHLDLGKEIVLSAEQQEQMNEDSKVGLERLVILKSDLLKFEEK